MRGHTRLHVAEQALGEIEQALGEIEQALGEIEQIDQRADVFSLYSYRTELCYDTVRHLIAFLEAEEIMAKVDQAAPQNDEFGPETDHTEKIKSQILAKTGRPKLLHHLEVCRHHNGNYRVNVWEKMEATGDSAFSTPVQIGSSYYLKVSDSGEIIRCNPPLTKIQR